MFNKQMGEMQQLWHRFVTDHELDSERLRPHVAASWQRCLQHNVNPFGPPQRHTVKTVDQNWSRDRLQYLTKVAQPVMENLFNFVGDSGFQVILAGSNGYILSLMGGDLESETATNFQPGDDWSEPVRGTNAIGTCLVEQMPLQIHGCEHYCEVNHHLTCSAAPIFEPDGALIGVLNVSGECQLDSLHTLGMVAAGANAIENQLRLSRTRNKLRAAYKYSTTITNAMSEGLVTVDNDGNIAKLNDAAAQILKISAPEVIGKNIGSVLGEDLPIVELLKTGVSYEEREVFLKNKGISIFSSGCLLYDDQGNNTGAVAVIHAPADMDKPKIKPRPRRKTIANSTRYTFDEIIGSGKEVTEAKRRAMIAAQSPSTVLLQGESGTGKEMFAQSIHRCGNRSEQPFVAINCAATPETLIESELFGYEEGAFTGARKGGKPGKIEMASGGTLFLDEIGDMPLHTQVKLLRVLQERKLSRVGSSVETEVDIRVIAATHKDLNQEIEAGRFRTDLYFRLNVLCINIPSLRDRLEDLPLLVKELAARLSDKLGRTDISIDDSFLRASYVHPWPGNIRELENVLERAINMAAEDGKLTADLMELQPGKPKADSERGDKVRPLKEAEREMIIMALDKSCGNIVKATQMLGISRNTMYRKIKEYEIEL